MANGDWNQLAQITSSVAFNHAIFVTAMAVAVPWLVIAASLLVTPISVLVTLAVIFAGGLLSVAGYMWLSSRMIAADIATCWGATSVTL